MRQYRGMPVSLRDLDPFFTQGALVFRQLMGQMIASRRKVNRWSQEALANEAGWSRQQLSRVELGISSIATDRLLALAEILDCEVADLIPTREDIAQSRQHAQSAALANIANMVKEHEGFGYVKANRSPEGTLTIETATKKGAATLVPNDTDQIQLADIPENEIAERVKELLKDTPWAQ